MSPPATGAIEGALPIEMIPSPTRSTSPTPQLHTPQTPLLHQHTPSSSSVTSVYPSSSSSHTISPRRRITHNSTLAIRWETGSESTTPPRRRTTRNPNLIIRWETDSESSISLPPKPTRPPPPTIRPPTTCTTGPQLSTPPSVIKSKQTSLASYFTPLSQKPPSKPAPDPAPAHTSPPEPEAASAPEPASISTTTRPPFVPVPHDRSTQKMPQHPHITLPQHVNPYKRRAAAKRRSCNPPQWTHKPAVQPLDPIVPPPSAPTPNHAPSRPSSSQVVNPYRRRPPRALPKPPPILQALYSSSASSSDSSLSECDSSSSSSSAYAPIALSEQRRTVPRRSARLQVQDSPRSADTAQNSIASILRDIQQDMEEISILTNQLQSMSTSTSEELDALSKRRDTITQMLSSITIPTPVPYTQLSEASMPPSTLDPMPSPPKESPSPPVT